MHLKNIIKEETSLPITNKPPTSLPSWKHVPTLGTLSKHVITINRPRSGKYHELKSSARKIRYDRESDGFGDIYMEIKSVSIPEVDHTLVSKNIEMLFPT